ncbi:hypothetical protein ACTWPB_00225 [Nocardia sp. IBHARD005]|uniref:hypothetical protein n=1 Tax=Nocardia sp. IBHARD005 TaxID=3457765 RepID=UPI00405994E9
MSNRKRVIVVADIIITAVLSFVAICLSLVSMLTVVLLADILDRCSVHPSCSADRALGFTILIGGTISGAVTGIVISARAWIACRPMVPGALVGIALMATAWVWSIPIAGG